ncbi:hypothetical protein EON65_41275 [archaeon]|nr:MAG: hypothetical protein EON65_41275 [archaeon]
MAARVIGPLQYEDTVLNLMAQFQYDHFKGRDEGETKLLQNDLGPYFAFGAMTEAFDYVALNLE